MYRHSGLDIDFYRWSQKFIYLERGRGRPTMYWNVKYAFIVLLHLLSCLLYQSQNIYEKEFRISHKHLTGSAFIPLPLVLLCHLALFFFSGTFIIFLFLTVQGCLCSIKLYAANFIDSSATSHQHFRGTEMTSIQLLQWYLNSSASFAFIGKKKKKEHETLK